MPKLEVGTFTEPCKRGEPIVFEFDLPDDIAVLHATIHLTTVSATEARLRLTYLTGTIGTARKHRFIAVRAGHEHPDLRAVEFVARATSFVSTSEVDGAYYLFALPA